MKGECWLSTQPPKTPRFRPPDHRNDAWFKMGREHIFFLKVIEWNENTSLGIHEETEVLSTMDTWHWASMITQDLCPWNGFVHRPRHRTFTDEEEITI
jgi:hypothetical protein